MNMKEWSKEKFKEYLRGAITKMMEGTLDYAEVSIGNKERYKVLRSKILRLGNDSLRSVLAEVDKNYDVTFLRIGQDIVKVSNKSIDKKNK